MPKELFAILLTANLGILGASATAAPVDAVKEVEPGSAAVQPSSTYEVLSWNDIGDGQAQRGISPENSGGCGG